jgi:hypothetical protein
MQSPAGRPEKKLWVVQPTHRDHGDVQLLIENGKLLIINGGINFPGKAAIGIIGTPVKVPVFTFS